MMWLYFNSSYICYVGRFLIEIVEDCIQLYPTHAVHQSLDSLKAVAHITILRSTNQIFITKE
jgi:hypothetical protein